MTIAEWIRGAEARLAAIVDSPRLEAQLLAAHVLLVDRAFLLAHPECEFPDLAGESLLQRRESGEPLAYVLGWREFYGRRFQVRPGVLIPRQETEILVESALGRLKANPAADVLDLGTGSGCLAVTIKLEVPDARVTASDVSAEAVDVARSNAETLGADVRFLQGDGFGPVDGESFDLIVTNPPYIGDFEDLPAEVRDFEPRQALLSGPNGLEFYERLSAQAAEHLRESGRLMMEVGYRQSRDVALLFESTGWNVEEVREDLSGIERVVVVQPLFAGRG